MIFRALVTCSTFFWPKVRSNSLLMIEATGCPFGPLGKIAFWIDGRLAASSGFTSKLLGSGLNFSSSTIRLSSSSDSSVFSASALLMNFTSATWLIPSSLLFVAAISALVASGKSAYWTLSWSRTSSLLPWAVWKIGISIPSRTTVTTVVTIAARLGAPLRFSARRASWMKNRIRLISSAQVVVVGVAVGELLALAADAHPSPHPQAEFGRRLLGVAAGDLVADDAALVELDDAPLHVVHHLAVVGDDDDGGAGLVDPVEQLHDPDRGDRVEVSARLVGQQQRRVVDEGAGDGDALLLATGELVGVAVELGRQADQAQGLRHLLANFGAAGADHLQGIGDVVVDRAVGQQLEVLEDGADVAPQLRDLLLRQLADVAAGDLDRALAGGELANQHLDQRRLAAAGGPYEEDELAAA